MRVAGVNPWISSLQPPLERGPFARPVGDYDVKIFPPEI